ncbi:MAG: hypothetical protein DI562_08385 [Stenotrophomonas acidaminiphila]|nr:MAG: hypothetical protein DI562_08385 [Stenotrophomonas acidaminiphila]
MGAATAGRVAVGAGGIAWAAQGRPGPAAAGPPARPAWCRTGLDESHASNDLPTGTKERRAGAISWRAGGYILIRR